MDIDNLDAEELFYLGIRASENNDHEKALIYFKRSVRIEKSARGLYLLGAEYAEIGMFERAYLTMQEAVTIDPGLWDAHFQSGLVKFVMGDFKTAEAVWMALDVLEENSPLVLFKTGILLFAGGNATEGEKLVNLGIERNITNPPLNQVMSSILTRLSEITAQQESAYHAENVDDGEDSNEKMNRLFMQAYKSKKLQ